MAFKRYFYVQRFSFKLFGIDTEATKPESILKRPLLCYVPLFFSCSHVVAILHYAYANRHDYNEVTDSLALACQSLLSIWKLLIFLAKRNQFSKIINHINLKNSRAEQNELAIIVDENEKGFKLTVIFFNAVKVAIFLAFTSPIFDALYAYFKTGGLVLRAPYKASYFWSHTQLPGYFLVYIWCALSVYSLIGITIAIDTTFVWLVTNIAAQFHVVNFRFREAAKACSATAKQDRNELLAMLKSCLKYHKQTLNLAKELNHVYREIIFFKFLISCSEICCLAFCLSRPSDSLAVVAYQGTFLMNVAFQLMMYCYYGQKIETESQLVASEIYFAFDWSCLHKPYTKLLYQAIMRAQESSKLKGVLFVLDLNLYVWAFKTAGTLITALKSLDENQD